MTCTWDNAFLFRSVVFLMPSYWKINLNSMKYGEHISISLLMDVPFGARSSAASVMEYAPCLYMRPLLKVLVERSVENLQRSFIDQSLTSPYTVHGLNYGPLARHVKSRNVSPPLWVSNPDMHHGTCVTYVPWCMSGSLTSGFC